MPSFCRMRSYWNSRMRSVWETSSEYGTITEWHDRMYGTILTDHYYWAIGLTQHSDVGKFIGTIEGTWSTSLGIVFLVDWVFVLTIRRKFIGERKPEMSTTKAWNRTKFSIDCVKLQNSLCFTLAKNHSCPCPIWFLLTTWEKPTTTNARFSRDPRSCVALSLSLRYFVSLWRVELFILKALVHYDLNEP